MSLLFLSSWFILTFYMFNKLLMMSSLRRGSRQHIQGKKIPKTDITPQDVHRAGSSKRAKWYKDMSMGTIASSKGPRTATLFSGLSKLSWLCICTPRSCRPHFKVMQRKWGHEDIYFIFIVYVLSCLRRFPITGSSISSKQTHDFD